MVLIIIEVVLVKIHMKIISSLNKYSSMYKFKENAMGLLPI